MACPTRPTPRLRWLASILPHLACMWLDCGGFSNAFLSGCRNGGAFELRQVTWAFREARESPEVAGDLQVKGPALAAQSVHDWFHRLPWKRGHSPLVWTPDYEDYLLEIWGHEVFDEYWQQVGLCTEAHYPQFADVPQVHMGGWYDTYARSTTDNFVALSQMKDSPVWLIMGPLDPRGPFREPFRRRRFRKRRIPGRKPGPGFQPPAAPLLRPLAQG